MWRLLSTVSVLFLVLLCVVTCGNKEPLRIGFVGGLSGRGADLGVSGRNGAMLAVEQRNAAGGIHGRPVGLIVRDDEQDPDAAEYVMQDLLRQKVEAIVGPMTSSIAMLIVPLANKTKTLLVSPTATTTYLTGIDDYFFRVIADTSAYAALNARFQFEQLGHRSVVVIYDLANKAYTESWLNGFRAEFERLGGTFLATRTFHSGIDIAFYDMVWDLLEADPDFVLVIANVVDAAQICQQVRKTNDELPIALSEWASTERFRELAGHAADNVYVSQFFDRNDSSERYHTFLAAYQKRFGQEPGFAGLAGYDAAQVVLEGLTRRTPGRTLKSTLLELRSFEGGQQSFSFDRSGDTNRKTFLSVIRNGHYQTLE